MGPMFHQVVRGDKVVHLVGQPVPSMIKVNSDGRIITDDDAFIAVMVCGRRCKMNTGGRNRFTTQPATCLVCVAGGYK